MNLSNESSNQLAKWTGSKRTLTNYPYSIGTDLNEFILPVFLNRTGFIMKIYKITNLLNQLRHFFSYKC